MIAAQIPDLLVFKTNADWVEQPWQFETSSGASDDFTGCTFVGGAYVGGVLIFAAASYLNIDSATSPAQVSWRVPLSALAGKLGAMTVSISVVTPANGTQALLTGAARGELP